MHTADGAIDTWNEFWAKNPQKVRSPCVIFQSPNFKNVNTKYLAHKNLLENSFNLLLTQNVWSENSLEVPTNSQVPLINFQQI